MLLSSSVSASSYSPFVILISVTDWNSWLTQADVDGMVAAGLNTIRVPLGFWIIEDIVDKSHEPYAEGGLDELVRFFDSDITADTEKHAGTDSWSQHVQGWRVM